jgi:HEPN domain-containing protein
MEKGRLIYMRKATSAWVTDCEEELESAQVLYQHGRYKRACYHSQQSVEKGLKAMIIERGQRPKRTYDIVELFDAVMEMGVNSGLTTEDAVYLNSIYRGRYPTEEGLLPHGEPSKPQTEKALLAAQHHVERLKLLPE